MSIRFFIAGLCFFFLPGFGMYDVLPDFIGALLILRAINRLPLISLAAQEASKGFTRLCYFSLFRLLSAFFLSVLFSSLGSEQSAGFETLLTIICCGFELFFSIVAFRALFEALSYLQTRHGSTLPLTALSDLRTVTYTFLIAKHVLNVLPTLDGLFGSQYNASLDRNMRGIEYYTTLLEMFNLVLVTIFGIVWLCLTVRYFKRLDAQKELLAQIDALYEAEVALRPQYVLRRRLRTVCLLIGAACFFSIDIAIDRIFLLPDPIAAALLLVVCIYLYQDGFAEKKILWFSGATVALSLAAELATDYFNVEHAQNAAYRGLQYHPAILGGYLLHSILQILSQAMLLFLIYQLLRAFLTIIDAHTGHNGDRLSEKNLQEDHDLHASLKRRVWRVFVLACIYAASSVAYAFVLPFFELYWLIQLVVGVTFAVQTMGTATSIYDQIEYKYM